MLARVAEVNPVQCYAEPGALQLMDASFEFETLRRESSSWWHIARRKLLREAVAQAVHDKREARVLDFGCSAQLDSCESPGITAVNAHSSLAVLAFQQIEGSRDLVCTNPEELGFTSNSFDAVVAGDILQIGSRRPCGFARVAPRAQRWWPAVPDRSRLSRALG